MVSPETGLPRLTTQTQSGSAEEGPMRMMRWSVLACAFSLLLVLFSASSPRAQEQTAPARYLTEFRGPTMGGTFSVKVVTAKDELENAGFGDVDQALRS